jgi:electron transport complex protein RnfD
MSPRSPIPGPHTRAGERVPAIMGTVMLALTPATAFGLYLFGWPAIHLFVITLVATVVAEAGCLRLAGKSVGTGLKDGSALLTGWLLGMSLPPWAPWWIGVIGAIFAIVVGKHVFGGLGQNLFNPAMLARVTLLVAFPLEMTAWAAPPPLGADGALGFLQALSITLAGVAAPDGVTGATVLGAVKTALAEGQGLTSSLQHSFEPGQAALGAMPGSLGETSALLLLGGGLLLLGRRIITWHIPVAMLLGLTLPAGGLHLVHPAQFSDPVFHGLTGGAMLGAFFIATDPVTSPNSPLGKLLFGAGCGLLVYLIRVFGGYPEGIAFAVLLMNAVTPVIDHYTRPRIYGRTRQGAPLPVAAAHTAPAQPPVREAPARRDSLQGLPNAGYAPAPPAASKRQVH